MARKWTAATDESFALQNEMAVREAREAEHIEPRADFVSYDASRGMILVEMKNGFVFGFAPERVPGLAGANAEQLSAIRISPSGDGLHWDELNAHLSLGGLVETAFNLREWAPRYLGQMKSEAKARAARENGLKGGRPRKRTTALKAISRRTGAKA